MGVRLEVDLHHRFAGGETLAAAFQAEPGITVLLGASGSGKTTVLRAVAGLLKPGGGSIRLGDRIWFDGARGLMLPPQARRVGWVPQEGLLFPHLSVRANLAFAGAPQDRVAHLLELLGLSELADRRPSALSGGQRQRAALGRALATQPAVLLLDEPLSALDRPEQERLRRELRALMATLGIPCLWVTHDRDEALAVGDAALVMDQGRVIQHGNLTEIFHRPADPSAARLLGVDNLWPGQVVERRDGLVRVDLGPVALWAPEAAFGHPSVWVSLRGEEVLLESPGPSRHSARNGLSGQVLAVQDEGSLVRVTLDIGLPLVAKVTRPAVQELGLRPGAAVTALVKAPALHLIAREG